MKLNKTLRFLYVCQTYPKQIKNQANQETTEAAKYRTAKSFG